MSERVSEQPTLKREFELLLSDGVRPFLRSRGFAKTGTTFRRHRESLYDVIGFQEDWHNGVRPWHGFFINVGIGSAEVDATWPYKGPKLPIGYLFDRRWESVVPDLPYELSFSQTTDMAGFAAALCDGLDQVLAVIDQFDCTATLVRYAIENNLLIQYERTCCYLATREDQSDLMEYVGLLRDRFGHQERWAIFNREIAKVTGARTSTLVELGLLDPMDTL